MQIKRPVCYLAISVLLVILCVVYSGMINHTEAAADGQMTTLQGLVIQKEYKTTMGQKNLLVYLQTEPQSESLSEVVLYMKKMEPEPKLGQVIRIRGKVSLFQTATNPGEFDSRTYYQILKIAYRIKNAEILAASKQYSQLKETLYQIKLHMAAILEYSFSESDAAILKTMLLGDKSTLDAEIKGLYQSSGIIHVLAISGLHISMLGMGFYKLLKKCYVPVWISTPVAIIFILCFGIMTGMGSSSIRAIFMFVIHLIAELTGRSYDLLTALSLTGILMLLEQPLWVKHSGFLLSFGAVVAIAVFLPGWGAFWKNEKLEKLKILHPGTCIAAVTLPILLSFYYVFPPYSMLLNLVVIPLMSLVLGFTILDILTGLLFLQIAPFVGIPCGIILSLYEQSCKLSQTLPGSSLILGKPQVWQIISYYVLLAAALWLNPEKLPRWGRKMLLVSAFGFLLLRETPGLTTTFLDVGQGDGIVVQNDNGHVYLIDGGSTSKKEVGTYQIIPFLKYSGIGTIEAAFVSHPDEDHVSGIKTLLELSDENGVRIKKLFLPDASKKIKEAQLWELRTIAQEHQVPVFYLKRGDSFQDHKLYVTALAPRQGMETEEMNEISEVLLVQYKEYSMLLTGDTTGTGESEMLNALEERLPFISGQRICVLKIAHHGSKYSTPEKLLTLASPKLGIVSAGKDNSYNHPHLELLARFEKYAIPILRTDERGAITIYTNGEKEWFKSIDKSVKNGVY